MEAAAAARFRAFSQKKGNCSGVMTGRKQRGSAKRTIQGPNLRHELNTLAVRVDEEEEMKEEDVEEMVVSEDEETANNFYLQDSFKTPV